VDAVAGEVDAEQVETGVEQVAAPPGIALAEPRVLGCERDASFVGECRCEWQPRLTGRPVDECVFAVGAVTVDAQHAWCRTLDTPRDAEPRRHRYADPRLADDLLADVTL